jgi:hypothetical protein
LVFGTAASAEVVKSVSAIASLVFSSDLEVARSRNIQGSAGLQFFTSADLAAIFGVRGSFSLVFTTAASIEGAVAPSTVLRIDCRSEPRFRINMESGSSSKYRILSEPSYIFDRRE